MLTKQQWIDKCKYWRDKWPILKEQDNINDDSRGINLYKFVDILNQNLDDNSVVTADSGSCIYVLGQYLSLKGNSRYINSSAISEMGSALPLAIGCSLERNKGRVICLCGDGGFQMNLQELATVKYHNLPIIIFYWNNQGYLTIKNTQKNYFKNNFVGIGPDYGLWFPEIKKIAEAYNIDYIKCENINKLNLFIKTILNSEKTIICEIICPENQEIRPFSMPKNKKQVGLEDMAPFLLKEEIDKELI